MSTELPSITNTPHSPTTPASKPSVVVALRPMNISEPTPAEADAAFDDGEPLARAIEELNRYVAGSRTDLRFSIDREEGRVVVSIIDAESGQVLRQMPSVEALRISRYLEHDRLGLIRQRA